MSRSESHTGSRKRPPVPPVPARLYVLPAARAPLAVVFRMGPHQWWHLLLWHLDTGDLEPGAWFRGSLYPRRCDLSPDGKYLSYFAYKVGGGDFLGQEWHHTYIAVSHAPWLFALVAWREIGTYTRGYHFVAADEATQPHDYPPGSAGHTGKLQTRYGLALTNPLQYAVEQRRGWTPHEACPSRGPNDMWDERRQVILAKPRPLGPGRLVLADTGHRTDVPGAINGRLPSYTLELPKRPIPLADIVWADWDSVGRLLLATRTGQIQIVDPDGPEFHIIRRHDLNDMRPAPRRAPDWAQHW